MGNGERLRGVNRKWGRVKGWKWGRVKGWEMGKGVRSGKGFGNGEGLRGGKWGRAKRREMGKC